MKECNQYDNWCEKEKRSCKNCYYERGYNMSDEEKKAFQYYKEYLKSRLYENEGCKFIDVAQSDLRIFLNLIETQQKEIEELKTEKAKRSWVHIKENGEVEPLFYVSEDKIKAKIQECREILYSFEKELELKANKEKYINKESMNCLLSQISILQSLLEK